MHSNIKSIDFVKFNFLNDLTEKTTIDCNLRFTSQTPNDAEAALTKRAILVTFEAKAKEDRLTLETKARVVFSFENSADIPEDDVFLKEYCKDAYIAFRKKILDTLSVMGINGFSFPDDIDI